MQSQRSPEIVSAASRPLRDAATPPDKIFGALRTIVGAYLRHQGPMLDTRILPRTLRAVLRVGGR